MLYNCFVNCHSTDVSVFFIFLILFIQIFYSFKDFFELMTINFPFHFLHFLVNWMNSLRDILEIIWKRKRHCLVFVSNLYKCKFFPSISDKTNSSLFNQKQKKIAFKFSSFKEFFQYSKLIFAPAITECFSRIFLFLLITETNFF